MLVTTVNQYLGGPPPHYAFIVIIGVMTSSSLLQPTFDIGCALVKFWFNAKVNGQKTGPYLGHKFLLRISGLSAKLFQTVEPLFCSGPVAIMPTSA